MVKISKIFRFALDGNEANVSNRVGSNVYAFEILSHLEKITRSNSQVSCEILLSAPPKPDLPQERSGWKYRIITPRKLWTQWALPLYLFWHKDNYDVLFTPGHYAPRISSVPYVSSVMDLAFLEYSEQFQPQDLLQLTNWTKYSVKHAKKIVTISQFSKKMITETYHIDPQNIIVAYPDVTFSPKSSLKQFESFLKKYKIHEPYILYLGTLQPRKNLKRLITAYEILCRSIAANQVKKKTRQKDTRQQPLPQLVIAGKIGWLAEGIVKRIKKSPFKNQIIQTGFVPNNIKKPLYEKAICSVLIGVYEGFGIPPLESLYSGTIPLVSQTSSLPEVVGQAGIQVNPHKTDSIAKGLAEIWSMTVKRKAIYRRLAREQIKKFSWEKSAQIILSTLKEVAESEI